MATSNSIGTVISGRFARRSHLACLGHSSALTGLRVQHVSFNCTLLLCTASASLPACAGSLCPCSGQANCTYKRTCVSYKLSELVHKAAGSHGRHTETSTEDMLAALQVGLSGSESLTRPRLNQANEQLECGCPRDDTRGAAHGSMAASQAPVLRPCTRLHTASTRMSQSMISVSNIRYRSAS